MVSSRCIAFTRNELTKIGIPVLKVEPGIIELESKLPEVLVVDFNTQLLKLGMEILNEEQSKIIAFVLDAIDKNITSSPNLLSKEDLRILITINNYNYEEVFHLFSEVKGMDLMQYVKIQKIEQVKGMLIYDDYSLNEIAEMLHFRNQLQLSRLFKKITGLTPSYYKKFKKGRKKNAQRILEEV